MINPEKPDYTNTPASPRRAEYSFRSRPEECAAAVSIITPFFNTGPIFHETAASVFRQSLQQFEWIIVDDCSDTAESKAVLREYEDADPRIRVVRRERRGGPAAARNLGAKLATAEYLFLLDSDDLIEPTALEKLSWFLDSRAELSFADSYSVGFGELEYLWRHGFSRREAFLEANCTTGRSMIRREVYLQVGGADETIHGGFEDWDFWLRCASAGYWGGTIAEYLEWYRRRKDHSDRWKDMDQGQRARLFHKQLKEKYPALYTKGFPRPVAPSSQYTTLRRDIPFSNRLDRGPGCKRLLLLAPHLELGGADKFNLDLIGRLKEDHGYEITVATTLGGGTHPWRHCFEQLTPDVFTLDTFLLESDYPRFIEYLIKSRDIGTVLIASSQFAYQLLPFLRAEFKDIVFADYLHMEEEYWKSGGYPRFSLNYAPFLDITITSSQHLKQWMLDRGGNPERIHVCTTNIDAAHWSRTHHDLTELRDRYEIPAGVPVIAYAARFCDQKQPELLAEVMLRLKKSGQRFVCLAAGHGPLWNQVAKFVRSHKLSELRLLGAVSNEEIREILAVADIYFMPSKMEGIALSIYEAMSMGAVPVAAKVGGQDELVTPDTGVLIERGVREADEYTEALANLLSDPDERAKMALRGRERICSLFTLSRMGDRIASLLAMPPCEPFDVSLVLQTWRYGLATEIVEQNRVEQLAHYLWHQVMRPESQMNEDYTRVLSKTAGLLRGNIFLLPQILRESGIGMRHLVWAGLVVFSPRQFLLNFRNLRLLGRVLARPLAREKFLKTFDARFYLAENTDVQLSNAIPLLHYTLLGYRENRRPAPNVEPTEIVLRNPDLQRSGINPVLWVALQEQKPPSTQSANLVEDLPN